MESNIIQQAHAVISQLWELDRKLWNVERETYRGSGQRVLVLKSIIDIHNMIRPLEVAEMLKEMTK